MVQISCAASRFRRSASSELTESIPCDEQVFTEEQARHEAAYLVGTNPRQQSGFGWDARDWERFRRVIEYTLFEAQA